MATWSNCVSQFRAIAAGVMLTTLPGALLPLSAQEQPPPQPAQAQQLLSETQLQQLVAPIALYPDSLLAQILTASTYPLEVAMAARWSEKIQSSRAQRSKMRCKTSRGIRASRD